jgi:MFS transporter, PHS family, inorganic phosphate transporter
VGNIIVQSAGYLPGYYIGLFLPDLIGRVRQQFWGSLLVSILYAIWAGVSSLSNASTGALMTLFTLSQLVLNSGPNQATFLLPVEVFPTRVRGTAHGLAAASGKCGAVLTAFAFGTVTERIGMSGVLGLFSGIMVLCAILTCWIPETKNVTIEDVENEVLYGGKRANAVDYAAVENGKSVESDENEGVMKMAEQPKVEDKEFS